jgi:hypothetical protein
MAHTRSFITVTTWLPCLQDPIPSEWKLPLYFRQPGQTILDLSTLQEKVLPFFFEVNKLTFVREQSFYILSLIPTLMVMTQVQMKFV